ncbi:hypothetical protein CON65_12635 [Bacillus pseudomycoides]|uniref:Uncharacterized protein n=1 Tax=Bacillus pseudomycoides TaxID=64104 RepID=A0AA91VCD6_9BACI|nr:MULTISPECIES: hypothetical protein [Bacillus]PED82324.1 hypothetical protein CON65_12635 [Bacillus pseudomycoides]PFW63034.1 hypothetical protein COL20_10460 [Bacillus sp. AFS075034]
MGLIKPKVVGKRMATGTVRANGSKDMITIGGLGFKPSTVVITSKFTNSGRLENYTLQTYTSMSYSSVINGFGGRMYQTGTMDAWYSTVTVTNNSFSFTVLDDTCVFEWIAYE